MEDLDGQIGYQVAPEVGLEFGPERLVLELHLQTRVAGAFRCVGQKVLFVVVNLDDVSRVDHGIQGVDDTLVCLCVADTRSAVVVEELDSCRRRRLVSGAGRVGVDRISPRRSRVQIPDLNPLGHVGGNQSVFG